MEISKTIVIALIVLGGATIGFVIATLFTSLTERELEISSTVEVELSSDEFRAALESITTSTALPLDSEVEIFNDGTLFLNDLISEMEQASSSITITNYIFKEGVMVDKTFDALIAKAREGVAVRILLDAHGGLHANEEKLEELERVGGKVKFFRPMNMRTLTRLHRRTHVRAIVIDGKVGYTGGLAFQDEWLGNGVGEESWRDLMFKYRGHMARATQDHFNALWRQTDGEILVGDSFYPAVVEGPSNPGSYFVSLLHAPAPDVSGDLLDIIWLTISGAQNHIYLASPYLTPPKEILEALKSAVDRGVRVEVMLPGDYIDARSIRAAGRYYYKDLLEAGVHIYEYQPGRFHGKWLTADGHFSLIGSANMDNRSATLNVENIFGIEDEAFTTKLEEEFVRTRAKSQEILLENFTPNIFERTFYRIAALFTKQF